MNLTHEEEIEILSGFISDQRKERIEDVLSKRTKYLTVVLEDIYHPPNASAVLRTAECLGIQDIHIIENHKKYRPNSDVAIGSSKWLNLKHYNKSNDNSMECLEQLKKDGFKIAATLPEFDGNVYSPESLPLDNPLAVCFGTEETGLSQKILNMADYKVKIPMFGFTESYNISVAASIMLYTINFRLRNMHENDIKSASGFSLEKDDEKEIRLVWYRKCVKNYCRILNHILNRK